ncbi:MAG: methyltransferase domain-containing protein [Nitriliruptorales bacterium]|nr:methyltransferase domain-containing protein [Nitriliruptorales bacterium]
MANSDRVAEFSTGEIGSAPLRRRARERIHWLVDHAHGRTLDLGCGQSIASILAGRRGCDVVRVDREFDRLESAATDRRAETAGVARRIAFVNASGAALPFRDGAFDRALLGEVLERLLEPEKVLAEVARVLRPDGLAAITVPLGHTPDHDQVCTFYPASAADLISPFLPVTSLAIVDTHLRIVARPPDAPPTGDEGDAMALVHAQQPVLEQHLHDTEVALQEARHRLAEVEEESRSTVEALRRDVEELRGDLAEARWRVAAMRAQRWWRLGAALGRARREPTRAWRLPREVLQIVRRPSQWHDPPRRVGPTTLGSRVSIPSLSPPQGPIVRPDLKVATILDPFSALCFRYEFQCVSFGQSDWRRVLERQRPDLLLVESAWAGNDGRWSHTMTAGGGPRAPLVELVGWCRRRGIPTVFWNKEDPASHDLFLATARQFDHVFTVDEQCLLRYRARLGHDRVHVLPFAAQPRIHNPVRVGDGRVYDVAFAGMYFAEKHEKRREQMQTILDPARDFGLHIYSRQDGSDPRYRFPDKYARHIVGTVPYETMLAVYKLYRVFLNVNTVTASPTMCARRLFELSACGTTVLSGASNAIEQFFDPGLIAVSDAPAQTRRLLASLLGNAELRDRRGLRAQRTVMGAHTFGHRVDALLETVGLGTARPVPLVSAIVPTNRAGQLDHAIASIARQRYRPLELVLILHGLEVDPGAVERQARAAGIGQVTVVPAPASLSLGHCLNLGIDLARGDYLAKMDDDNVYAEDYLTDLVSAFTYTDAGVVGKLAHYAHLASRNVTLLRFADEEHRYADLVQGGTMVIDSRIARRLRFRDLATGEDTDFLRRCRREGVRIYAADRFNFVSVRQADPSMHTWKVSDDDLLTGSTVEFYGPAPEHVTV